jgi:hypothetical protein
LSYQSPGNDKFIDPTGIPPLNDFDYSIFPAKQSCDIELVMYPLVAEFENQIPDISILSMLLPLSIEPSYDTEPVIPTLVARLENQTPKLSIMYPISAERDILGPT